MKLELITLGGIKLIDDVYEVLLPTPDGVIAVLPGHERLVTLAVSGVVSVRRNRTDRDDAMEHYATFGGIVEVSPQRVRILVDEADTADDIIEAEAQAAMDRAALLRDTAKDRVELAHAQVMMDRQAVRLKVAGLRKRAH
jgi:F-type H+-transporting ATPase subunit epsilon